MANYLKVMKNGYEDIINAIIRPVRCKYNIEELGPSKFQFREKTFERTDFFLLNERGMRIACSFWEPDGTSRDSEKLPCVIYLHGNSSARVESLMQLSLVLAVGATFFSFDFTGSGLSDGDYVSLGKFEKEDLKCVTEYLRRLGSVSSIVLWGRSMGAVTALLYLSEHEKLDRDIANGKSSLSDVGNKKEDLAGTANDNELSSSNLISGVILDSPFSDLKVLAEDIIENGRKIGLYAPGFVVDYVMNTIQKKIQKTVGFDIKDIRPIATVGSLSTPALFVAAASDRFISPTHSQVLSEHYGGDCKFIVVDGDHNAVRSSIMYSEAFRFLAVSLDIPRSQISHKSLCVYDAYPWSNLAQTRLMMEASNSPPDRIKINPTSLEAIHQRSSLDSFELIAAASGIGGGGGGGISSAISNKSDILNQESESVGLVVEGNESVIMVSIVDSFRAMQKVVSLDNFDHKEQTSSDSLLSLTISGTATPANQSELNPASGPSITSNYKESQDDFELNLACSRSSLSDGCSDYDAMLEEFDSGLLDSSVNGIEVQCGQCKYWNVGEEEICMACHSPLT